MEGRDKRVKKGLSRKERALRDWGIARENGPCVVEGLPERTGVAWFSHSACLRLDRVRIRIEWLKVERDVISCVVLYSTHKWRGRSRRTGGRGVISDSSVVFLCAICLISM